VKLVSAAFKYAWAKKTGKRARIKVSYMRRYWNGSAMAYEAAWTDLMENKISQVGDITQNLDTDFESVFDSTQVTLIADNARNQWLQGQTSGSIFAADAVAPSGYFLKSTKIRVQWGYQLSDGTVEYCTLFTGVIVDILPTSDKATVSILAQDFSYLMQAQSATAVSDAITGGACTALGDGTTKVFTTSDTGIDHLNSVYVAGVAVTSNFWSISNVNQAGPASITLKNAPSAGQAVTYDGLKWKQSMQIETIVGLLCDVSGISVGTRTIAPVIFPGLSGSKTVNSQSGWKTGSSMINIDPDYIPDSIIADWVANPAAWSVGGYMQVSGTIPLLQIPYPRFSGTASAQQPAAYGTFSWTMFCLVQHTGAYGKVWFISDSPSNPQNGYCLQKSNGGYMQETWSLIKVKGGSSTVLTSVTLDLALGTTDGCITITRDPSGNFTVYRATRYQNTPGTQLLSAIDNDVITSSYMFVDVDTQMTQSPPAFVMTSITWGAGVAPAYGGVYSVPSDPTVPISYTIGGQWTSAEFDILSVPTALGTLDHQEILNGGMVTYLTAFHASPGQAYSDGEFQAISNINQILSSPARYFKVRVIITPGSGVFASPEVQQIVVNFTVSTVTLTLANNSNKNCWDMVQRYAQMCGYATGFDSIGNFSFKPKSVSGSPIMPWTGSNVISKISRWETGLQKIVNTGRVTFANKQTVYDCNSAGEAHPNSVDINGSLDGGGGEDWSDILLANDVDIASARSRIIHDQRHVEKIRMTIDGKIVPWIDPLDVISTTYLEDPKFANNIAGDPLQLPGFAGANPQVLANGLVCKIIGAIYKPDSASGQYIVEEVLS
jgi:hypothetical protein